VTHPTAQPIATARPASTVMLLRDAASGLEVFMAQRSRALDFARGALVFPGGAVDAADADPAWRSLCRGADDIGDEELARRVAALRETFEEIGVLCAEPRGEANALDGQQLREWRAECMGRESANDAFREVVARAELRLRVDALVPWSRWITPRDLPKRFDTWFYAIRAPAGQRPIHDGEELVASTWVTPQQGLADYAAGRCEMIIATWMNLERLCPSPDVAHALASAGRHAIVPIEPRIETRDDAAWLVIPENCGYERTEVPSQERRPTNPSGAQRDQARRR